ncbi:MAG: hypothetical protein ACI90V_009383, partial [Bacillariaceae sp.]
GCFGSSPYIECGRNDKSSLFFHEINKFVV